jgi:hypothetical protein
MANFMSSSSRSKMGSNVFTTQNQGGGSKKAGFPYQVGRDTWTSIFFNTTDPVSGNCCTLAKMQINLFPKTNQSRPIGSTYSPNTYFRVV